MAIAFRAITGWQKIIEYVVPDEEDTQTVEIENINIESGGVVTIMVHATENEEQASNVFLYVNEETEDANYHSSLVDPILNVMTAAYANNPSIAKIPSGSSIFIVGTLYYHVDTGVNYVGDNKYSSAENLQPEQAVMNNSTIEANITKLTFALVAGSKFQGGSRFVLFKKV